MRRLTSLILLLIFYTSCGVKNSSKKARESSVGIVKSYSVCGPSQDSKVYEILDFSRSFINSLGMQNKGLGNVDVEAFLKRYRYIEISENDLITSFEGLKKRLLKYISFRKIQSMQSGVKVSLNSTEESVMLAELSEIYDIYRKSDRWLNKLCSSQSILHDKDYLRSFLKIKDTNCTNTECLDNIDEHDYTADLIGLCLSKREPLVCKIEHDINKKAKNLDKYFNRYFKVASSEYNNFFILNANSNAKLKCVKQDDTSIININVKVPNGYSSRFSKALLHSSELWSNEKIQIVFHINSFEYDLKIELVDHTVSHYSKDNGNKIAISKSSLGTNLNQLLAHELGHYLGFPDCYIEYFSRNRETLHYLEMSPIGENIMCSLDESAMVMDGYYKALENAYCL